MINAICSLEKPQPPGQRESSRPRLIFPFFNEVVTTPPGSSSDSIPPKLEDALQSTPKPGLFFFPPPKLLLFLFLCRFSQNLAPRISTATYFFPPFLMAIVPLGRDFSLDRDGVRILLQDPGKGRYSLPDFSLEEASRFPSRDIVEDSVWLLLGLTFTFLPGSPSLR